MTDTNTQSLKPGDYHPPPPGALRSACPVVNCLANHGYISRDGRNITADDFRAAIGNLGAGFGIIEMLVRGSFIEHVHVDEATSSSSGAAATESTPLTSSAAAPYKPDIACSHGGGPLSGLRPKGQVNTEGVPVLHLDQISRHGAVEHDVSLSRLDAAQGDNTTPQPHLIEALLACSSDGKVITTADLGRHRKARYAQQKLANPQLNFGPGVERLACTEAALIQSVFGTGFFWWTLPVPYMRALFMEERLPIQEGWTKRRWPFRVTLFEMVALTQVMKRYARVEVEKEKRT